MKTDQEMVRWALEESSEPVIKNPYLRNMFAGGQLVQPGPGRQGFKGEGKGSPGVPKSEAHKAKIKETHWSKKKDIRKITHSPKKIAYWESKTTIQKAILEQVENGVLNSKQIAKNLKLSHKEVIDDSEKLFRNIYEQRMKVNKGQKVTSRILPKTREGLKGLLNDLWKVEGFATPEGRNWFKLIRDARESGKITIEQFEQANKNVTNFFKLKNEIQLKYPKLILNLDHPLSYGALEGLGAKGEKFLTGIPTTERFNKGIKQRLDNKYASVVSDVRQGASGAVEKKIAIEKLAKNLNIDIGEISKSGKKIVSLGQKSIVLGDKKKIGKSIIQSLKEQNILAKKIKEGVDPKLLKAADMENYFKRVKLPETSKKEFKGLVKLIRQLGCGLYSGGRVAFANAGKVDCFGKGLEKIQTKNIATKGDAAVMKKIVEVGAKKGAARTALMWLGPLGLGGDVLFEAGDIAVQMLGGKPLDESLRGNWITGMFIDQTEKEARDIKLFKDTGPGAKTYVQGSEAYEKLQKMYKALQMMKQKQVGSRLIGKEITDADIKKMEEDVAAQERYTIMLDKKESAFIGGAGQEEYQKASDELEDKRGAASWSTAQKLKYREDQPTSDRYKPMNIDIEFKPKLPDPKQFDTVEKMAEFFISDEDWEHYKPFGWKDKTELFTEARKQDPKFNKQVWHNIMNYGDPEIKGSGESFFRGTYDKAPGGPHFAEGGIASLKK